MAEWEATRHDASEINNGEKYEVDDNVSIEELNSIVENSLYAMDTADHTVVDYTEIAEGAGGTNPLDNYYTKGETQNLISNPNLLINGDFKVNQRGATTYTSTGSGTNQRIYGCDRLNIFNGAIVEIQNNGGINVVFPNRYAGVRYRMETVDYEKLLGKTVTFSVKISNSTFNRSTREIGIFSTSSLATKQFSSDGIFSVTATLPSSMTELDFRVITYSSDSNTDTMTIDWWKVELGSIATPFSPRPYAEELALCQRYYQYFSGKNLYSGRGNSNSYFSASIVLSAPLRVIGTTNITSSALTIMKSNGYEQPTISSITEIKSIGNFRTLTVSTNSSTLAFNYSYIVRFNDGFYIDAEIY